MRHLALLSFLLFSFVRARALPETTPLFLLKRGKDSNKQGAKNEQQTVATTSDQNSGCGPTVSLLVVFNNGVYEIRSKPGPGSAEPDIQFPINIHKKECLDSLTKTARTFAAAMLSNVGDSPARKMPTSAEIQTAKTSTLKKFKAWISKSAAVKSKDSKPVESGTTAKDPKHNSRELVSRESKRATWRSIRNDDTALAERELQLREELMTSEEVTTSMGQSEKMAVTWKNVYGNLKAQSNYDKAVTLIVASIPIWYLVDDVFQFETNETPAYHAAVIVFVIFTYLAFMFSSFEPIKMLTRARQEPISVDLWKKMVSHIAAVTHTVSTIKEGLQNAKSMITEQAVEISSLMGVLWVLAKDHEETQKQVKALQMTQAEQAKEIVALKKQVQTAQQKQKSALVITPQTVEQTNTAWLNLARSGTDEMVIQQGIQFLNDFMGGKQ